MTENKKTTEELLESLDEYFCDHEDHFLKELVRGLIESPLSQITLSEKEEAIFQKSRVREIFESILKDIGFEYRNLWIVENNLFTE